MNDESLRCPSCNNIVASDRRSCHICEADIGFPNVRYAQKEEDELLGRYRSAISSAEAKNITKVVNDFEEAIETSHIIMVRPLMTVIELIQSDNKMMTTFAKAVSGNARLAEDNIWDKARNSAEEAIHPNYSNSIHYAALSLNEYGVKYYGNCHIKLKTGYVKNRTSFFEENPMLFFKKHNLTIGQPIPCGYRSTWQNKSKLAVSKLHSKLSNEINKSDFPGIVINDDGEDSDFIEAHLYGAVHKEIFESVSILGMDAKEKALFNAYKSVFSDQGINVNIE